MNWDQKRTGRRPQKYRGLEERRSVTFLDDGEGPAHGIHKRPPIPRNKTFKFPALLTLCTRVVSNVAFLPASAGLTPEGSVPNQPLGD